MRISNGCLAAALMALGAAGAANAEVLQGRLELKWGDAERGSDRVPQFTATLFTDDGVRHPLDPAQALHAADNLFALSNRRIAMAFDTDPQSPLRIDAIVAADNLQFAVPPENAVSGTTPWVTLMCKFNDIATEQKPRSFFQGQYGNGTGQLDQYWREVSYGKINLTGSDAYGWFTLPHPRSYYVTQVNGKDKADLGKLFTDCTQAADPSVNFAVVPGGVQGINMMFNGDLDGYAWGGGHCATLDGANKCWSTTWDPPWAFNNLAPLTHEMGHGYGLPHANNSDNDSDPYDNPWDVLSDAWDNAGRDPTYGVVAKHISTYSRDQLGWVDPARKVNVQAGSYRTGISLDRASLAGSNNAQMIIVRVPGEPSSRYYTVEARRRVGYYEGNLAGDAVIIHAVDTSRGEPAWSVDASVPPANTANNEGSMFKPGETWAAPGNAFRLRVHAPTAQGFRVSVCGGLVTPTAHGGRVPKAVDLCDQVKPPPRKPPPTPPSVPHGPTCPHGKCYSTVTAPAEG